jgi:hypothetical protein
VRLGGFVDHDFHCMLGDTHIHEDLGYALNYGFGILLPKAFPHVRMNDWHSAPPYANLALSESPTTPFYAGKTA